MSRQLNLQAAPRLTESALDASLKIAHLVSQSGGKAYWVGGCVRDGLMGIESTDADMEVFGLSSDALQDCLSQNFQVAAVGVSFGIFKLKGIPVDVGLPRTESKASTGHKGFSVQGDPGLSIKEAAARRDFTINALYYDPLAETLHDPYGGLIDIQSRILRHTSTAFIEDPLRVLRGMQFLARFQLVAHPSLIEICQTMQMEDLPAERQFEEWKKLLLQGIEISRGLGFLKESGWLRYYPELEALDGCPQDPRWHPEGDVFIHTGHCLDAFARERINNQWEDLVVGLAVLCHDFGKPQTTITANDRITSHNHDIEGEIPARNFLQRITRHQELIEEVLPLVVHHMMPNQLHRSNAGDSAIRRLSRRAGRIDRLVRVVSADMQGSPPKIRDRSACDWLLNRASQLAVLDAAPDPIIQGRHLIELGEQPGPDFREILDACYEAQLEGEFNDLSQGKAYVRSLLKHRSKTNCN